MKKSLIFWFAAVTCAALFLVGCESPTNGDAGAAGANAPGTLPSGATPAMLAALFETTDTVIVGLPLGEGTFTVPAGKTLAVAGTVDISSVDDTVINAYYGTLDVSDGGFTVDSGNVFIVPQAKVAEVKAALTGAGVVPEKFTGTLSGSTPALTAPAVFESLGIGGSGQITAADFATFTASYPAYVVGDVTIDASTAAVLSSANLTVYGEIKAGGTSASLTLGANVKGSLTATSNLTLAGTITGVTKLDTGAFTVSSALTSVSLTELNSGAGGKFVLTGDVTAAAIGGGNGNIEFSSATLTIGNGDTFGNTGLTAFTNAAGVAVTTGDITFKGPVTFAGDLTLTAKGAIFYSSASFAASKGLKLVAVTDSKVTLKPGAALGITDAHTVWGYVLANYGSADVVLTPVANTKLTVSGANLSARTITQSSIPDNAVHGITITGKASLVAGSTYTVASASNKVGTLTVTGELHLGAGVLTGPDTYDDNSAKLVLTSDTSTYGAKLTGAGKVVAGNTEIGGTNGWQAVGAGSSSKIIISVDTIDAQVAAGTGDAAGILTAQTTAATITVKNGGTLTVEHGTIDISAASTSFVLEGATGAGSKLLLKGATTAPGKLKVSAESSDVKIGTTTTAANFLITATSEESATNAVVTNAAGGAILAADSIVCTAAAENATSGSVLGTIGGGAATKDVLITGPSGENSATFLATSKVKVPNSDV